MRSSMPSPGSVLFLLGSVAMKRKEYEFQVFNFLLNQNFSIILNWRKIIYLAREA
jgi:hypothetical protein